MVGIVIVENVFVGNFVFILIVVYDGLLFGGLFKGIEVYVIVDIVDLSVYGVGFVINGGGIDGEEYIFLAVSVFEG